MILIQDCIIIWPSVIIQKQVDFLVAIPLFMLNLIIKNNVLLKIVFVICQLFLLDYAQAKEPIGTLYFSDGKSLIQYDMDSETVSSYDIATGSPYAFYLPYPHKINKHIKMKPLVTQIYFPIVDKNNTVTYLSEKKISEEKASYEIHSIKLDLPNVIEKVYRTEREIFPEGLVESKDNYILYRDVYHSEDTSSYYSWGFTVIPKPSVINAMVLDRDLTDISEGKWFSNNMKLFYSGKSTKIIRTYHDLTTEKYHEKALPINSSVLFGKLSRSGNKILYLNNEGKNTYDISGNSWQTVMDFSVGENILWVFSQWSKDDDKVVFWTVKTNAKNKKLFNQDIYIYDLKDKKLERVFSFKPTRLFSPSNYIQWNSSQNYLLLKQGDSESFKFKLIILDIKNQKIIKTIPMVEPWKIVGWF
jgi:hypothetical protein